MLRQEVSMDTRRAQLLRVALVVGRDVSRAEVE